MALSVYADAEEKRGPSLFWFSLMARPTTDLSALEKLLYEEIERIQKSSVQDSELSKVRMQLRRQRAQQLYSTRSRANSMGHFAVYYDDPGLINKVWGVYEQITNTDIQRAAQKYFTESNRTVVTTVRLDSVSEIMSQSMATLYRIFCTVLALATGLALASPALCQDSAATPPSKVERKNRAPVARDILSVKLPKPVEAKLKNGLTVLIIEDRRAPFVSLQLQIGGAGGLFEPAAMTGLAGVTAQMLREGTKSKTSIQLAEEIDRLGASIGASSSFGSSDTVLSASGLSDNFDDWLGIAFEILLQPSFAADELEKLKQRLRVQLREQRSNANFLLSERFNRAVYGDHPAANVSVTTESLDRLTQDALRNWHRERYAPQNSILGIAGDVRAKELIAKLEKRLAGWKKSDLKPALPGDPQAASARKIFLVHRPNSVQTTLSLGNIAIDRRSPDYMPMVVMNDIIGGGASARLFLNLREEKGYTYGVYSDFTALRYPGPWRA
ncbi:MAG TPA: insulinase family protein, partial [Candidatus Deferrimicrobium sp.]|nr:insulinase family protein [Candidatus Deferrimicrobium sp.]